MSELEELFEQHTQRYGGLYQGKDNNIERIKRNFYQTLDIYKKERAHLDIPDVYLDVTNYDRFQAFTFKKNDMYFMAISIGTIRSLLNFFNYLYSQPSFLAGEFGSELEVENIKPVISNSSRLISNFYNYDLDIEPNSGIRKHLAYQTFFKAIDYLLMHELAHINHGHLDYNVQTDDNFMMFEEDMIKNSKMNIRKALEYDADCSATTMTAAPHPIVGWSTHNASIEGRLVVIAMYFLFKLPGLTNYKISDFNNKTYPSPAQRFAIQLGTLATLYLEVEKKWSLDAEELIDIASKTYFECITVSEKIFFQEKLDDKTLFFFSKQSKEYFDLVRGSWNEIRDELDVFAYVPIALYDDDLDFSSHFDYNELKLKSRDKNVDGNNPV